MFVEEEWRFSAFESDTVMVAACTLMMGWMEIVEPVGCCGV